MSLRMLGRLCPVNVCTTITSGSVLAVVEMLLSCYLDALSGPIAVSSLV